MKVGLLIIASEVLNGKIKDINTHFLAEYLRRNHLELDAQVTVRDEMSAIHAGLDHLYRSCDLVVTSGGVGPTKDDITKEALGSYMGRPSTYSPEAEKIAQDNYTRMGRHFPGKDHVYSIVPEGVTPLMNPTGFAPGYFAEHNGKLLFSGPGVPRELRNMVELHFPALIFPRIKDRELIELMIYRTRKVPEEKIFGEVDTQLWEKLSTVGEVSSLPVIYGVDIAIKVRAASEAELEQKKKAVHEIFVSSPVSAHLWHIGNEPLEEIIVKKATQLGLTFGFAESATGGLCSERITNVSGSSKCFFGSVVSYDNSVKTGVLMVKPATLTEDGVVSLATAEEMARGAAHLLKVDIVISITGIAGPSGGTTTTPVGTVCLGSFVKGEVSSQQFQFKGDRELLKNRFSQVALMSLHEALEKLA